jgi:phosphate transport system substrate-binding protein
VRTTKAHSRLGSRRWLAAALAVVALGILGGNLAAPSRTAAQSAVTITGAGSSFDYPLFSKMFSVWHGMHPNVQVNYQSIGSGGGQQQLFAGTVNFGASDAPLTDEQLKDHPTIVHIPITLGAVSVGYNLPGVPTGLRLSGDVLARIYLGQITSWADPAITGLNPNFKVPNLPIAVVHRSDGSGTSFIFTAYLSAINPTWKSKVGNGASVDWPTGVGAKGSEGVSGQVKQIPGGIGYFEMAYSIENKIPQATMENAASRWTMPSVQGAAVGAGQAAAHMPPDLRSMFVNAPGPTSYPIAGFSWVLVDSQRVSQPLIDLLTWMVHDGQQYATPLYYAPLPAQVVQLCDQKLKGLTPR